MIVLSLHETKDINLDNLYWMTDTQKHITTYIVYSMTSYYVKIKNWETTIHKMMYMDIYTDTSVGVYTQ